MFNVNERKHYVNTNDAISEQKSQELQKSDKKSTDELNIFTEENNVSANSENKTNTYGSQNSKAMEEINAKIYEEISALDEENEKIMTELTNAKEQLDETSKKEQVETVIDKKGNKIETVRDENGNKIKETETRPDGSQYVREYEYYENGNTRKSTETTSDGRQQVDEYDENDGHVIKQVNIRPDGTQALYEEEYDENGKWIRTTFIAYDGWTDIEEGEKEITINPPDSNGVIYKKERQRGNLIKETYTHSDGSQIEVTYGNSNGDKYIDEYDKNGNKIKNTYISSDGNQEIHEYDKNGNEIKEINILYSDIYAQNDNYIILSDGKIFNKETLESFPLAEELDKGDPEALVKLENLDDYTKSQIQDYIQSRREE